MSKHFNPTIAEDAQRILNTKTGDNLPSELASDLVPVIQIERTTEVIKVVTKDTTASGVVYLTASNRDTYITGILMSLSSDVLADNTFMNVFATLKGVVTLIAQINKQPLTAGTKTLYIPFVKPIKVDRGVNISHSTTFTVGAVNFTTGLYGYEVETTNRT